MGAVLAGLVRITNNCADLGCRGSNVQAGAESRTDTFLSLRGRGLQLRHTHFER
jgi:hypothetical protein